MSADRGRCPSCGHWRPLLSVVVDSREHARCTDGAFALEAFLAEVRGDPSAGVLDQRLAPERRPAA